MPTNKAPHSDLPVSGPTNMYGCLPCPKCQGEYRWPDQSGVIHCDDCGFEESVASRSPQSETSEETSTL